MKEPNLSIIPETRSLFEDHSVCGSIRKSNKKFHSENEEYAVSTIMNSMLRQSRCPATEEKIKNSKEQGSSKRVVTNGSDRDSKETPHLIPRRKLRINSAEDGGLLNAPHAFTRPNQPLPGVTEVSVDFRKSVGQELEEDSMSGSFESIEKKKTPLNFAPNNLLAVAPQATVFRRRKSSLAIMETREMKDLQGTSVDTRRESEVFVGGALVNLQMFIRPIMHRIETKEIQLPQEVKPQQHFEDSVILSKLEETLSHELTLSNTMKKPTPQQNLSGREASQSSGTVDFEGLTSDHLQKLLEETIQNKAQLKQKMKRLDVRIHSLKRSLYQEDHLTVKRSPDASSFVRETTGDRLIVRAKSRADEQTTLPAKPKRSPIIALRTIEQIQSEPRDLNPMKIRPSSKRQMGSNNLGLSTSMFQDKSRSLSTSQTGNDRSKSFKVRSNSKAHSCRSTEAFVID